MNFVGKIVEIIFNRKKTFVISFLLFVAFAVWVVSRANFSENVYDILPVSDTTVSAHLKATYSPLFFSKT